MKLLWLRYGSEPDGVPVGDLYAGKPRTPAERAVLSRSLSLLVKRQLVVRDRDTRPGGRRTVRVMLTDAGRRWGEARGYIKET
jgi:hypothetical protein